MIGFRYPPLQTEPQLSSIFLFHWPRGSCRCPFDQLAKCTWKGVTRPLGSSVAPVFFQKFQHFDFSSAKDYGNQKTACGKFRCCRAWRKTIGTPTGTKPEKTQKEPGVSVSRELRIYKRPPVRSYRVGLTHWWLNSPYYWEHRAMQMCGHVGDLHKKHRGLSGVIIYRITRSYLSTCFPTLWGLLRWPIVVKILTMWRKNW